MSPAVSYGTAAGYTGNAAITKYNVQNVGAVNTGTTFANANRFFQGYFLGGVVTGAGSTTLSDGSLDSTNALVLQRSGGNVGIGAATATDEFLLSKNQTTNTGIRVRNGNANSASYAEVVLETDAGTSGISMNSIAQTGYGGAGSMNIGTFGAARNLSLVTNNATRLTVDSAGSVGVGTSTFSGLFNVGTVNSSAQYSYFDGLRVSGEDTSNTIWNAGRSIRISSDTGTTISLCQTNTACTGLTVTTSSGNASLTGALTVANGSATAPSVNFTGATNQGLGYVSTPDSALPWSNGPVLTGATGWAYYSQTTGSYRMGFRGNSAGSIRYLWSADYVLFGEQPNDASVTHTLNVTGTAKITSSLSVGDITMGSLNAGARTLTVHGDNAGAEGGQINIYSSGGYSFNSAFYAIDAFQDNLRIYNGSTGTTLLGLSEGGTASLVSVSVSQQVTANGYMGRAGLGGATSNWFNHQWTGSCAQVWVDYTNVGNYACVSDQRVKQDVQTLNSAEGLSAIELLNPVTFNWKNSTSPGNLEYGFLAQEVQSVLPELVYNTGMVTDLTPDGMLRLNYDGLIAVVVKGVQELNVKVQNIEGRLAVLEAGQFAGSLTVQGDTTVQKLTVNGKIISSGTAPALALGPVLTNIMGAAIAGDGTDTAGTVVVNSGTQASAAGEIAEITFTSAYGTAPKVALSGNNAHSAKLGAYIVRTATGFKIVTDDPLQLGQTYSFDYIIIEARN